METQFLLTKFSFTKLTNNNSIQNGVFIFYGFINNL